MPGAQLTHTLPVVIYFGVCGIVCVWVGVCAHRLYMPINMYMSNRRGLKASILSNPLDEYCVITFIVLTVSSKTPVIVFYCTTKTINGQIQLLCSLSLWTPIRWRVWVSVYWYWPAFSFNKKFTIWHMCTSPLPGVCTSTFGITTDSLDGKKPYFLSHTEQHYWGWEARFDSWCLSHSDRLITSTFTFTIHGLSRVWFLQMWYFSRKPQPPPKDTHVCSKGLSFQHGWFTLF